MDRDLHCIGNDGIGRCPNRRSGDDAADEAAGWTVLNTCCICAKHTLHIGDVTPRRVSDWRAEQQAVEARQSAEYERATDAYWGDNRWEPREI